MSDPHALSFSRVIDAYDRARPTYPPEAVEWLVGHPPMVVCELGSGTGKLTARLVEAGHEVLATELDPVMAARLHERVPGARVAVSPAELIPMQSRTADVVICAQSFHWFDHPVALREIARVLRPGGTLAVVWNERDGSIPWVRKLAGLMAGRGQTDEDKHPILPLQETEHFGWVEEKQFRFWQTHDRASLLDLARSRSYVALMSDAEREGVLAKVSALYDDYGRGSDGMRLPYVTQCYKAVVRHQEPAPEPGPKAAVEEKKPPPEDPGTLLIDFR